MPYSTILRLRLRWKSQEKVCHICIICVSLTDFPEPPSVLASMFYHFKPDNDFAIRCIQKKRATVFGQAIIYLIVLAREPRKQTVTIVDTRNKSVADLVEREFLIMWIILCRFRTKEVLQILVTWVFILSIEGTTMDVHFQKNMSVSFVVSSLCIGYGNVSSMTSCYSQY
jgi:hypothetical protein